MFFIYSSQFEHLQLISHERFKQLNYRKPSRLLFDVSRSLRPYLTTLRSNDSLCAYALNIFIRYDPSFNKQKEERKEDRNSVP